LKVAAGLKEGLYCKLKGMAGISRCLVFTLVTSFGVGWQWAIKNPSVPALEVFRFARVDRRSGAMTPGLRAGWARYPRNPTKETTVQGTYPSFRASLLVGQFPPPTGTCSNIHAFGLPPWPPPSSSIEFHRQQPGNLQLVAFLLRLLGSSPSRGRSRALGQRGARTAT